MTFLFLAETDAATWLIDPLPQSVIADPASAVSSAGSGYCAGLLGAVADEAAGRPPAFDFLHPRKASKPPGRRKTYVSAGLAVAVVVLAVIGLNWLQTSRLEADIRKVKQEMAALEGDLKKAEKIVSDAGRVDAWLKSEVVWLEELDWLSQRFPEAKDAMLTNFSATGNNQRREMRLGGFARDVETVSKLDIGLLDSTHKIAVASKDENTSKSGYKIKFSSSVQISAPSK